MINVKSFLWKASISLCFIGMAHAAVAQSDFGRKAKSLYESHITYVQDQDYDNIQTSIVSFALEFRQLAEQDPDIALMLADKLSDTYNGNFFVKWSPDKNLVAISWDENTGGSMVSFDGFFMHRTNGYWSITDIEPKIQDGCCTGDLVYDIQQVDTEDGEVVYVVFQLFIGSHAITNHTVKTMSIENDSLNKTAKFIKTTSGLRHDIKYTNDFTEPGNQNSNLSHEDAKMKFDKKTKTILLPVIHGDGKLTKNKIKYKFNGKYFEKV